MPPSSQLFWDRSRTPGCRPLAQSLDPDRVPDLRVKLHVLHPPPSADAAQGFQLPDFYSGATDRIGRFTEGFLLRRLQAGRLRCQVSGDISWNDAHILLWGLA